MEESGMKLSKLLIAAMCFGLFCSLFAADVQAADKPILTVYNPLGTPPPIKLKAMAPRLDTIKGKTIYIVNDGYPGSSILLGELTKVMKEKYPGTTFIYRDKKGGMGRVDEALWKEIRRWLKKKKG